MAQPNILSNTWYFVISWRAETLLSKSLHVVAEIHTFFRAYQDRDFGTALRRAANILSYLVGSFGVQRGGALAPPEVPGVLPQGGAA